MMSKATILMLGDSLVDFGDWHNLLPNYAVLSSGVPGERAEELLSRVYRCDDIKELDGILVMTGTNNIFTGDPDYLPTIQLIIHELQQRFPGTPIMINSLVPFRIGSFTDLVCRINDSLRLLAERTASRYIDLYSQFDQAETSLFEFDGVHFSRAGYRVWAHLLASEFSTLLAKESD